MASDLFVDNIRDLAGTGPTTFPTGLRATGLVQDAASDSNEDKVLTSSDVRTRFMSPSVSNKSYYLPSGAGVKAGTTFILFNNSAVGTPVLLASSVDHLFVKASDASTIRRVFPQSYCHVMALQDNPSTAAHWKDIGPESGIFIPTSLFSLNWTVGTISAMHFQRNGAEVAFSGAVAASGVSSLLSGSCTLSIPIASSFTSSDDAFGTVNYANTSAKGRGIIADTTFDGISIRVDTITGFVGTSSGTVFYAGSYVIK